jgi:hypothetical protein
MMVDEPCPDCGIEVQILSDGTSDCPECGHPEVLPCCTCIRADNNTCDWSIETRCSEFPQHYLYNLVNTYVKEVYQ